MHGLLEVESTSVAVSSFEDLGSELLVRDSTLFVANPPYQVELTELSVSVNYLEAIERARFTVYLIFFSM